MWETLSNYPTPTVYILATIVMSPLTFLLFGWDKRQARTEGYRIPEKTLFTMALCCGWIGALAGQKYFRHKTIKMSFRITLWSIIALHIVVVICWGYSKLNLFGS